MIIHFLLKNGVNTRKIREKMRKEEETTGFLEAFGQDLDDMK